MSAISLKSITGITSITTPAGVDNQLTLHNNNTTEAVKLDIAGNVHINNQLAVAGVTTFLGDILFQCNSGNIFFDKSDNAFEFSDNVKAKFGGSADLEIYHSGSHSIIHDTGTGNLSIQSNAGEIQLSRGGSFEHMVRCIVNGAVELYHDGTKKFETTSSGIGVSGNVKLNDNYSSRYGTHEDLLIFHDGNSKIVNQNNSCDLRIYSDTIELKSNSGDEMMIKGVANGGVELYYDNVKKAYTNSQGLYITNTGGDAFFRLLAPTGYHATIDMTADTHTNEDNYRIQVNTDQKFRVYGKPGGNYTSFIELDQAGKVTLTRDVDVARHLDVDGHTELDNVRISGVVTATTYYGDGSNLSNITSTTINNNADNRIITGSGTANTLNGESSLTFDGNDLVVSGANVSEIKIDSDGGGFLSAGGSAIVAKGYFDYSGSVTGLYTNNAGQGVIGTKTNQEFHFIINNTKQLAITQNGYLVPETNNQDLGNSSKKWKDLYLSGNLKMTSGKGIDFSATSDASGKTSELLDDYEEGTFTGYLRSYYDGTSGQVASSDATYTKIGRKVFIQMRWLNPNTNGLPNGSLIQIGNMPFQPDNHKKCISTNFATFNVNLVNSSARHTFETDSNGWYGQINYNGSWGSWAVSNWRTSALYFYFSGTYLTEA